MSALPKIFAPRGDVIVAKPAKQPAVVIAHPRRPAAVSASLRRQHRRHRRLDSMTGGFVAAPSQSLLLIR